jgi:hypothetical protein
LSSTRFIQKFRIQNGWERKGNHRCDVGNTVVSSIIPFPLVFALKKHLASQKFHGNEVVKNEVTTQLHEHSAEFNSIAIQKLVPRLNKYLDKSGDYVEK